MLDSLKSLWISQDQANLAQFGERRVQQLKSSGFCRPFFDEIESFPRREEYWKYNSFKGLEKRSFRWAKPSRTNAVNKLGPSHFEICIWDISQGANWDIADNPWIQTIPQALSEDESSSKWIQFLNQKWPENFCSQINRSFLYSGLAISIPKNNSVRLDIRYEFEGSAEDFLPLHLLGHIGENTEVKIYESFAGTEFSGVAFYDKVFQLDANAKVHFLGQEQGSATSHLFQNTYARLEKDAVWTGLDLTLPSRWSRHNTTAQMLGSGAQSNLYGLYVNEQDYFCDHHTSVEHLKPQTFSKQVYKGVLAGKAEAVFNGKVTIAEGASKSASEQLNKNLLLSERAEIHTKPELKIYNDDVKATHGATVGQLDEEQLFYMQSRGLSADQAWDFLCQSFTGDVFREFSDENLSDYEVHMADVLKKMRPMDYV